MISEKLKIIMDKLGFTTQQSFADALGISRERVNNYLKKKSLPDTQFYQILKRNYPNIDVDSLIDDNIEYVNFGDGQVNPVSDIKKDTGKNENENDYINYLKDEIKFLRNLVMNNQQNPTSQMTAR